jgi:hypothetical protein
MLPESALRRPLHLLQHEVESFHWLRRTVASKQYAESDKAKLAKQLAEGITAGQIAELLGHANIKTTMGCISEQPKSSLKVA